MGNQQPNNNYPRRIGRALGILAILKLILALFAWWGRDPEEPVKWGELRWVFVIEFIVLAYILYKLHFANYALYY